MRVRDQPERVGDVTAGGDPTREWFRNWFGEEYLELYPHRDEAEAGRAVRLYLEAAGTPTGTVLDLACGAGRHLRELVGAGVQAVGLDLSGALLAEARRSAPRARLVRADMRRLPFADTVFGGLTSFFTSFGYFHSRAEDRRVALEVRRVLRTGAPFMLDFFNAQRVREELVPRDERRIGGQIVTQTRTIVEDTVVKRIRIQSSDTDEPAREFEERVRLYSPTELASLLASEGLETRHRFGDYGGGAYEPSAERLILVGVAA